jgi:hypothetical protein
VVNKTKGKIKTSILMPCPRKALGSKGGKKQLALEKEITAIRKSYAERIAKAAREMQKAAAEAIELEKKMMEECEELAGEGVEGQHTISYQPHGSIEDQMENLGEVLNAGLDDVQTLAIEMAKNAQALMEEN